MLTGIKSKLAADVRGDLNEYHDKASLIFHSNLIRSRIYLFFLYLGDPRRLFCGCSVPRDQWEIGKRCSVRATSNWIAWRLKWKQIISRLMGLISENNSRFPQPAILHMISVEGLSLLGMLSFYVCSLNFLELESSDLKADNF